MFSSDDLPRLDSGRQLTYREMGAIMKVTGGLMMEWQADPAIILKDKAQREHMVNLLRAEALDNDVINEMMEEFCNG